MITGWRSTLLALGYNVSTVTPHDRLETFLSKVRPVDCGIELIRIGSEMDGGYLVPNDLEGIEYCFSPGVSTLSDFENQLADAHIKSFLADYSVDAPPVQRSEFLFDKKFLGASDRGCYMTLETWKNKYLNGYSGDLILQMDIEGGEFEVIFNVSGDLLSQFRIVVIEFHGMNHLLDPFGFEIYSSCFEKLLDKFHVVHIHPNNCCGSTKTGIFEFPHVMEFTFLNKRRAPALKPQTSFPHKLDRQNLPGKPLVLPTCWYSDHSASSKHHG
ncbi:MAG TPA: FkbM family methyltransferase [Bryobacteraceae bacterium]|nr:FkbM family methyltransferase [Bryobacteraceae bacterium]